MKPIPTAEEFSRTYNLGKDVGLKEFMIEFAKLHVEAQRMEICHQMDLQLNESQEAQKIVNNSYSNENIK